MPVGVALLDTVEVGVTVGEGVTELEREGVVEEEAHAVRPAERLEEGLLDSLRVLLPLPEDLAVAVVEPEDFTLGVLLLERWVEGEEELLGVRDKDRRALREGKDVAVADTVGTAAPALARSRPTTPTPPSRAP